MCSAAVSLVFSTLVTTSHGAVTVVAQQAEHGQTAEPQDHPPPGLELQGRDLAAVAERVVQAEDHIAQRHRQEQLPIRVPAGPEDDEVRGEEPEERQGLSAGQLDWALLIGKPTAQRRDCDRARAEGDDGPGGDEPDHLRPRREREEQEAGDDERDEQTETRDALLVQPRHPVRGIAHARLRVRQARGQRGEDQAGVGRRDDGIDVEDDRQPHRAEHERDLCPWSRRVRERQSAPTVPEQIGGDGADERDLQKDAMVPVSTIEPMTAKGTFLCRFFVSPANSTP